VREADINYQPETSPAQLAFVDRFDECYFVADTRPNRMWFSGRQATLHSNGWWKGVLILSDFTHRYRIPPDVNFQLSGAIVYPKGKYISYCLWVIAG
jgi:hypothetical protein